MLALSWQVSALSHQPKFPEPTVVTARVVDRAGFEPKRIHNLSFARAIEQIGLFQFDFFNGSVQYSSCHLSLMG